MTMGMGRDRPNPVWNADQYAPKPVRQNRQEKRALQSQGSYPKFHGQSHHSRNMDKVLFLLGFR